MKIPKFLLRGFSRPGEAMLASLGRLERDVMEEIWRNQEMSVRQVTEAFGDRLVYTTVMTTLDRLYKKGLLKRRKEGRAFLYSSRCSPEELERGVAADVINNLLSAENESVEPILACMVDAVSDRDRQLLDELERLVRQKRLELENEE
ncbi:MAG TPA: BlaI/MecI/CopY family transcriptional regulator [Pyrinomonadaceae bacterium]|jgi:predicted transcriptional regulator